MPRDLYLVLSRPPKGISAEEYERFYAEHAQDNVDTPGFATAQRYALDETRGEAGHTHLALYEFGDDVDAVRARLANRVQTGEIVLPDWFGSIRFQSAICRPLGGELRPHRII